MTAYTKKLIEVALPLEAINKASARAVIFAQMVDDPSRCPDLFPTERAQGNPLGVAVVADPRDMLVSPAVRGNRT